MKGQNNSNGVMTPYKQKYNRSDSTGFDLLEIVNNDMINRFRKHTFPKIQKNSNNDFFIEPTKHIISNMGNFYVKWLILNTNYEPLHSHNYPMVQLPKKGYLMKVVIPATSDNPSDFMIEYVVDYHNIPIETIETIKRNTVTTNEFNNNEISFDVTRDEELNVEPFNSMKHSGVMNLISRPDFFSKYLQDAI